MAERPLISTAEAAILLGEPSVLFADTRWYLGEPGRGSDAYAGAHIPGAVFVDLDGDLSSHPGPGRHPLPEPAAFADRMGTIGFGDDHLVIAYDDQGGAIAARLWWMLRWIGHGEVRVLDGGLTGWRDNGLPLTDETPSRPAAALSVGETLTRQIDQEALASRLGSVRLLDARAPERYRGDEEPIDPVGGHIPTAINHPYESTLGPDERFLPAAELADAFAPASQETVVYCGSGVTACHDIVAMVQAGLPEPTLYPGSWSDWAASDRAIAVGPDPGAAPSG